LHNGNVGPVVQHIDQLIKDIGCLRHSEICPNDGKSGLSSRERVQAFFGDFLAATKNANEKEDEENANAASISANNDNCLDALMEKFVRRKRRICLRFTNGLEIIAFGNQ
jgi:hypothetical protein